MINSMRISPSETHLECFDGFFGGFNTNVDASIIGNMHNDVINIAEVATNNAATVLIFRATLVL